MLIGISEVMEILGVGRRLATKYLQMYMGKKRVKGTKYLVSKENFLEWVNNGGIK